MTRDDDKPIFLIGFMGSGKSTVGAMIAAQLQRTFVDLDRVIEQTHGATIAALFEKGEADFRDKEAAALRAISLDNAVIAVGGGTPCVGDNLAFMKAAGVVIYLQASAATLCARLGDGAGRPLLHGGVAERIATLLPARTPKYEAAHHVVATDALDPREVAARRAREVGDMSVQALTVQFPPDAHARGYSILIDDGNDNAAHDRFAARMREMFAARAAYIITDENVAALHGERYRAALQVDAAHLLIVPAGEAHKTLAEVGALGEKLSAAGCDRQSVIVALGGGVIGDLAGFVAATYQRGIDYVQVPTTLMAQIDSSVGGKTGVNLPSGKNLVGAFHQPRLVYADLATLQTLSRRDISAGVAELVKHCLLADEKLLVDLEMHAESLLAMADRAAFASLIAQSCAFKASVVVKDEREKLQSGGPGRAQLNFGHTVGHAIEAASHHTAEPLRHGEAVALGMIAAAEIGERLQRGVPGLAQRLRQLLPRLGLSTQLEKWLTPDVIARIGRDKKRATQRDANKNPGINFVLLAAIGEPVITWLALDQLREILQRLARK